MIPSKNSQRTHPVCDSWRPLRGEETSSEYDKPEVLSRLAAVLPPHDPQVP
jgi:hypothetical protein